MYDNSHIKLDPKAEDRTDSQRLGDEISSAIIQTGACWSTDVIDPIVSKKLQDRFGSGATHAQVWGGEIIGDTVGGFIYIGLKQLSRQISKLPGLGKIGDPIDNAIDMVRHKFDKSYTKSGEKALAHWAKEHHIDKDDPRYQRKLENYKYFQAESTIDSLIVAGAAAASNIVAQKYVFKNTNPWPVITGSKLVGSVATLTLMFGANKTFPNFMQTLDHELSDRYFSKLANSIKSGLGLEGSKLDADLAPEPLDKKEGKPYHFPVLETVTTGTLTSLFLQKMADREEELVHFLPKSLAIGGAMAGGMLAAHWLIPDSIRTFNRELSTRYLPGWRRMLGMGKDKAAGDQQEENNAPIDIKDMQQAMPLANDKRERFLASLQRQFNEQGMEDAKAFVAEQKQVCQAFIKALYPEGRFAKALTSQYSDTIGAGENDKGKIANEMHDMLLHRRDAMLARLKLLDDPVFVSELEALLKSKKPLLAAAGVSPEKKEKLINGLLQAKGSHAGEEAVARITDEAARQRSQQEAMFAAFAPDSEAAQVLASELSAQLPKDIKTNVQATARAYMQERQEAARNVLSVLAEDGDVVESAIQRSQSKQVRASSWQAAIKQQAADRSAERNVTV